jgi:hypothetical protein
MKLPWNAAPRATIPFSLLESNPTESKSPAALLQSVRLAFQGWFEVGRDSHSITWRNAKDQFRMLELIEGNGGFPPINTASIHDYRRVMRQNALEQGHGILEVQTTCVDGLSALKTITKYPLEHQLGFGYNGWLCVPLPTMTFSLYSKALEQNLSNQRAVIFGALAMAKEINVSADPHAWIRDPYDPEFDEVALHHLADQAQFDDLFPQHPLTLVRQDLEILERETVFAFKTRTRVDERKP